MVLTRDTGIITLMKSGCNLINILKSDAKCLIWLINKEHFGWFTSIQLDDYNYVLIDFEPVFIVYTFTRCLG